MMAPSSIGIANQPVAGGGAGKVIFRTVLMLAGLWTLYCVVDFWWTMTHIDQVLVPIMRDMGIELDAASMPAARAGFVGSYQLSRLGWWAAVTVVLLLVALVTRPRGSGKAGFGQ